MRSTERAAYSTTWVNLSLPELNSNSDITTNCRYLQLPFFLHIFLLWSGCTQGHFQFWDVGSPLRFNPETLYTRASYLHAVQPAALHLSAHTSPLYYHTVCKLVHGACCGHGGKNNLAFPFRAEMTSLPPQDYLENPVMMLLHAQ